MKGVCYPRITPNAVANYLSDQTVAVPQILYFLIVMRNIMKGDEEKQKNNQFRGYSTVFFWKLEKCS
uniref:Uncharacterized protein n=1 Tax=Arundo donax TaxID=35708 RepID=A0A0A9GUN0_ARUDO